MPCWQCARRQTDPARGPSLWRRAVFGGEQILVCPDCSNVPGWDACLDACARCGSRKLVKALGEVSCRACGALSEPGELVRAAGVGIVRSAGPSGPSGPGSGAAGLSQDEGLARAVEEALRRRRLA